MVTNLIRDFLHIGSLRSSGIQLQWYDSTLAVIQQKWKTSATSSVSSNHFNLWIILEVPAWHFVYMLKVLIEWKRYKHCKSLKVPWSQQSAPRTAIGWYFAKLLRHVTELTPEWCYLGLLYVLLKFSLENSDCKNMENCSFYQKAAENNG